MSMAGGTGSGVGSYYTELLNDIYERITICNNCIWPFKSGEVTLQNYNFLLTLNKLYETSDSVILLENDILNQICKRISTNQKKEITFDDLNLIAAHKLASLIQPCNSTFNSTQNYLNEIIGELCPNNDYKLLSLNNVPQMSKESIAFSTHKWTSLYRNAKQLLFTGGYVDENEPQNLELTNKSISLCFFARGGDLDTGWSNTINEHIDLINSYFDVNYLNKYFSTNLYGSLAHRPIKLWLNKRNFNNYDKNLTFLSNSQSPVFKIESLVSKAWAMFSQKAYLHHYVKYSNFDESLLLNSFIFAEQLIKNYKNI
jgi:tubulin delta